VASRKHRIALFVTFAQHEKSQTLDSQPQDMADVDREPDERQRIAVGVFAAKLAEDS
jgi:hypothetical protein